jgi:hypothetical protein
MKRFLRGWLGITGKTPETLRIDAWIAALQGQINANQVILSFVLEMLGPEDRARLSSHVKDAVGKGFAGNPEWIDDERLKKFYRNSMSAALQDAVRYLDGD